MDGTRVLYTGSSQARVWCERESFVEGVRLLCLSMNFSSFSVRF